MKERFIPPTCIILAVTLTLLQSLSTNGKMLNDTLFLSGLRESSIRTRERVTTSESRSPEASERTVHVPEPNKKAHLYLGKEETLECFNQTRMATAHLDNYFPNQYCIECFNPKATHFYREIYASKGSIVANSSFEKDLLKKLPLTGCQVVYHLDGKLQCYCALRVQVPSGFELILIDILENSGSEVQIYDGTATKTFTPDFVSKDNYMDDITKHIARKSVDIIFFIDTELPTSHSRIQLRFQALPKQGLEVRRTGPNRGIGQTSLYLSPHLVKIGKNNPVSCNISVPSGHVIIISFPGIELVNFYVRLFAGDNGRLVRFFSDEFDPSRATLYNTSLIVIVMQSYLKPLRFFFSFHNESAVPVKLPDGSWNCSVSYVSDFLYHLSCNIEVECNDAADEADCSYTTDLCGPRYLTLGGGCFFYVMKQKVGPTTWNEASGVCLARAARLASLNTMAKWTGAMRVMPITASIYTYVIVGINNAPSTQPMWYQNTYQWVDSSSAFYLNTTLNPGVHTKTVKRECGKLDIQISLLGHTGEITLEPGCNTKTRAHILCEKPMPFESSQNSIQINATGLWPRDHAYIQCPRAHYSHHFLACDVASACWYGDRSMLCHSPQASHVRSFACTDRIVRVPYELVCDYRADCVDGSDEDFCTFPPCLTGQFLCSNKQCIPVTKVNDCWEDCYNGDDENGCFEEPVYTESVFPPALVKLTEKGSLVVRPMGANSSSQQNGACPHTHFQCLDNGFCLPVILRCNGVNDCPGREDEGGCESCPGFYRCRGSGVCLHYSDLCDGHGHCPQHDDELMCNSTCPPFCVCRGLAFFCNQNLTASDYSLLRYLDGSGSGLNPAPLTKNPFMIYLSLANCSLSEIDGLVLPNLLILNAQDNHLKSVSRLKLIGVPQLRELSIAGNPLTLAFEDIGDRRFFRHILKLDLSRIEMHGLNITALTAFPNLHVLNLSSNGVERVLGEGFSVLEQLRVVDLRGCPMTWFPRGLFDRLKNLEAVHAHNFKMCCSAVLPSDFNLHKCYTISDEISSCEDLLRGKGYSVCVFALSLLAVVGNAISFAFRSYVSKREKKLGYGNLVTHLSASDFLMGIYLAIIGAADLVFRGRYLWNDVGWRYSAACKLAGFLSLLSSEVSTLIMCLITLDRFLVLRFPFSQLHFRPTSAHVASAVVWVCGVLLVSVPLLPWTSSWDFYSQTSICIPLPTTRTSFAGHGYSFGILIVLNFVLFVVISMGQLSIYQSIRANSMSVSNTTKKTKDLAIACRLITVAITDFMCWFPVGVMGLLAFGGFPIPGEVNVIVAIFVLPLNSAVNPCLYTFNVILERRGRAREDKLRALLLAQLKSRS